MKRTVKVELLAETTLTDAELGNLVGAFGQDLTKACIGRVAATVGSLRDDDARSVWQRLRLSEKPSPSAKTWTPTRPRRDA